MSWQRDGGSDRLRAVAVRPAGVVLVSCVFFMSRSGGRVVRPLARALPGRASDEALARAPDMLERVVPGPHRSADTPEYRGRFPAAVTDRADGDPIQPAAVEGWATGRQPLHRPSRETAPRRRHGGPSGEGAQLGEAVPRPWEADTGAIQAIPRYAASPLHRMNTQKEILIPNSDEAAYRRAGRREPGDPVV